jgi:5-oxoprolinase (ATP-hydrolysing)
VPSATYCPRTVSAEAAAPLSAALPEEGDHNAAFAAIDARVRHLKLDVTEQLLQQGVSETDAAFQVTVGCCYEGADSIFQVPYSPSLRADFVQLHLQETSFTMRRNVVATAVRVKGAGQAFQMTPTDFADELARVEAAAPTSIALPEPISVSQSYFDFPDGGGGRRVPTPVYALASLPAGAHVPGCAIIVDATQTIVVEPSATALILAEHVVLKVRSAKPPAAAEDDQGELVVDPIQLAVFGHRFMSIAEQMGHVLQRTSISISIKVRVLGTM